ncbi:MAG: TIM barrel protein [Anaerovorax sp.]|nr:TIM barrel protein [Anaerovorax sp.]
MIEKNCIAGSNHSYIHFPFHDFAAAQKEFGIKKIDLVGAAPHLWCDHLERIKTEVIQKELEAFDLRVSVFTPKVYRYSICAEKESKQAMATIDYYKNCIEAAETLQCGIVSITAEGGCTDLPYNILWDNCCSMLKELSDFAQQKKIVLVLSTVSKEDSSILTHLDEVENMISEVHSESLCAMLDVNVISICGETITQWFEHLGDKIKLVRFVDGNYNGYRVWGDGCLPCEKFLSELVQVGYQGILSLQVPGERYVEDPFSADRRNQKTLEKFLK